MHAASAELGPATKWSLGRQWNLRDHVRGGESSPLLHLTHQHGVLAQSGCVQLQEREVFIISMAYLCRAAASS